MASKSGWASLEASSAIGPKSFSNRVHDDFVSTLNLFMNTENGDPVAGLRPVSECGVNFLAVSPTNMSNRELLEQYPRMSVENRNAFPPILFTISCLVAVSYLESVSPTQSMISCKLSTNLSHPEATVNIFWKFYRHAIIVCITETRVC